MKGADRLQAIVDKWKKGLPYETAQAQLLTGAGRLNRAAFNIAVEQGLCLVCLKWQKCIVKDCNKYSNTPDKRCVWFEAIKKGE